MNPTKREPGLTRCTTGLSFAQAGSVVLPHVSGTEGKTHLKLEQIQTLHNKSLLCCVEILQKQQSTLILVKVQQYFAGNLIYFELN